MAESPRGNRRSTDQSQLNLNGANVEQLITIDGVDPETAEQIVKYRQTNGRFESFDDLRQIADVDDTQYNVLRQHTTL